MHPEPVSGNLTVRQFSNGEVIVNTGGTTTTVALSGGTKTSVAPHDGKIMQDRYSQTPHNHAHPRNTPICRGFLPVGTPQRTASYRTTAHGRVAMG